MRRFLIILFAALTVGATGAVVLAPAASASVYNGTVEFTCTTFTAAGTGSHVLDRDNTGAGQEQLRIDVTDGLGNLLYTITFQNTLGTYAAGMIATTNYATAPQANPIRFTLTSLAGNGLPEQVDVDVTGDCESVPTANCDVPDQVAGTSAATVQASAGALCGTLAVTKVVEGAADPGTTFPVNVVCAAPLPMEPDPAPAALPIGNEAPFETTLTFGETGGTQTLAITDGATCTVTEPVVPPGCSLVGITPSVPVDIVLDETTTVAVVNTCQLTVSPLVVQPRFTG